jgi:hypothetical protein
MKPPATTSATTPNATAPSAIAVRRRWRSTLRQAIASGPMV